MVPIYCISLRETPERTVAAISHFKEMKLDVNIFQGIHGRTWGLMTTVPYNDDRTPEMGDYFITPGHVGLCLSHYMLWNHIWHSGLAEAIIVEDDVIFCHDFLNEFQLSRNALPQDWQIAYIGYCCCEGLPIQSVNDRISIIQYPLCTHAYMVARDALPVLMDKSAIAWSHIDIQLAKRALPYLKHYEFTPALANQRTYLREWTSCTY